STALLLAVMAALAAEGRARAERAGPLEEPPAEVDWAPTMGEPEPAVDDASATPAADKPGATEAVDGSAPQPQPTPPASAAPSEPAPRLPVPRAPGHEATDAEILSEDKRWHLTEMRFRASFYDQRGHGYQSQDGPKGGPGSEATTIFQPIASF